MEKKYLSKEIISLLILTTITIFTWIVFSVYQVFQKPLLINVSKEQLKKINPTLDTKTLMSLKTKLTLNLEEINNFPELTKFELKTPVVKQEASSSGTQEASPSAKKTNF